MKRLQWGVLGTGDIAKQMIPAINRGSSGLVVAVASRSAEKAAAFAAELGIEKSYGSYEALLCDPEVDAVYNSLPNSLHVPWSLRSLEAGKHVLCEKPLATSVEGVMELIRMSELKGVRIAEGFMFRYHPQWLRVKSLLVSGEIGNPQLFQGAFCYTNHDAGNIRNKPELGGGALMDVGCYLINAARWIFAQEPLTVTATLIRGALFHTDVLDSIVMDFTSGQAVLSCGTQLASYQFVTVVGNKGQISLDKPFNVGSAATKVDLYRGSGVPDHEHKVFEFGAVDQQTLQADAFAEAIINNSELLVPIVDSLANARVIEAVERSARSSKKTLVMQKAAILG